MRPHSLVVVLAAIGCNTRSPASTIDAPRVDAPAGDAGPPSDAPLVDGAPSHSGLPATMFSINWPAPVVSVATSNSPWPTSVGNAYGSLRTWGSDVDWARIEPALVAGARCNPVIDNVRWVWGELDDLLAKTRGLGVDNLHFVTADYPAWSNGGGGSGALPTDVAETSTECTAIPAAFRTAAGLRKGDCIFQEFVFALAMHVCPACTAATGPWQGALGIRSFSAGNEINNTKYVTPPCNASSPVPCANVARMASDLYRIIKYIDPTVIVGTPSTAGLTGDAVMAAYLAQAAAFAPTADVEIFHIYGQQGEIGAGMPEVNWSSRIAAYAALSTKYLGGAPLWVDEGGWGQNFQTNASGQPCGQDTSCGCSSAPVAACMDADNVATNQTILGEINAPAPGYLVRGYLQMIAAGVARFYWYSPNSGEWGSLGDCAGDRTSCAFRNGAAAWAWQAMYQWLVGATMGTLAVNGTQYTYPIVSKDPSQRTGCGDAHATVGYRAVIAWDTTTGSSLACGAFTQYCTLFSDAGGGAYAAGASQPCTGAVTLGPDPILLE